MASDFISDEDMKTLEAHGAAKDHPGAAPDFISDDEMSAHEAANPLPAHMAQNTPIAASAAAGFMSFPFAHQIGAAGKTAMDVATGVTPIGASLDEYRQQRDALKKDLDETQAVNPKSALLGSIGSMSAIPMQGEGALAKFGAAQGLSNSNADLTKGEIAPAAWDTAKGWATGQVLGDAIDQGGKVIKPVVDYLANKFKGAAGKLAVQATKVPGVTVFNKFPENAGQELLDRGIVGFGDTQSGIAKKATAALDASGNEIGNSLGQLDAMGGQVPKSQIIDQLRQRAQALAEDDSQLDVSDGLNRLADRLEEQAKLSPSASLSAAEKIKRGFQNKVNYNGSVLDNSVNREAAGAYQNAVEQNATALDPGLGDQFQAAKKDYGLLSPIEEATAKKASVYSQGPALNLHALRPGAIGAALGGEEGYRHGGFPGMVAGGFAGAVIGPRMASSAAVGSDMIAQALKASPQSFGRWAPVLSAAAQRGGTALPATDFMLQQTDPEYRQHIRALQEQQQNRSPSDQEGP